MPLASFPNEADRPLDWIGSVNKQARFQSTDKHNAQANEPMHASMAGGRSLNDQCNFRSEHCVRERASKFAQEASKLEEQWWRQ